MRDLWWRAAGYVRLRLTSADWAGRLRRLTDAGIRLERIEPVDDLRVEFSLRRQDQQRAAELLSKSGDSLELLGRGGLPEHLKRWAARPLVLLTLVLITAATICLPGQILHIRVEGNGEIPARRILEAAEDCGLRFFARRRSLRSEQVKNALLARLPELGWAGVNTSGCQAVIYVRPRDDGAAGEDSAYCDALVAVRDALVTDLTVTGGTGLCVPGQIVRRGQALVSGYTDLGICTRAQSAAGEVWGITGREIRAVVPDKMVKAAPTGEIVKKYSMILGKKRINFYSDSGILYGTCGKMREVIWLTLPGGWELPLGLVTERYDLTQCASASRASAAELLSQTAEQALQAEMIAGRILSKTEQVAREGTLWILKAEYECREMIARPRQGLYLEGDTNDDRENGERRTG